MRWAVLGKFSWTQFWMRVVSSSSVGANGCDVPSTPSRRRFCRALSNSSIVESTCAAYLVGQCTRENQRSRPQTPPVPAAVVGVTD